MAETYGSNGETHVAAKRDLETERGTLLYQNQSSHVQNAGHEELAAERKSLLDQSESHDESGEKTARSGEKTARSADPPNRILRWISRKVSFWKDKILALLTQPMFYFFVFCLACCGLAGWWGGGVIFEKTVQAKDWFRNDSPYSILWYYAIFCMGSIFLLPYSPFCLAMGFIFGVGQGFVIQTGALLLSSAICFAIGRFLFKDWVLAAPLLSQFSVRTNLTRPSRPCTTAGGILAQLSRCLQDDSEADCQGLA